MKKRNAHIQQRVPVFLGCEGESEQAYGQVLNDLIRVKNIPVHIEVVNLSPGAGDPLSRIRLAIKEIARRSARRGNFELKVVLLDMDQVQNFPQRRLEAEKFATEAGISVIWQEPCHEALLLRHLAGCANYRPPSSSAALQALVGQWQGYRKPMTKSLLSRRLGYEEVLRAASVEPLLADFLRQVKILD